MYKLYNQEYMGVINQIVIRTDSPDSYTSIPMNEDNADYQAYLKWVAEGNTPLSADE
jgi:hypothetical protein